MLGICNHFESSKTTIDRQNSESNNCLNVQSWTAYFGLDRLSSCNTEIADGYSDRNTEIADGYSDRNTGIADGYSDDDEITVPQSSIQGPFMPAKNKRTIELSPNLTTEPEKSTDISEMTNLGEDVSESPSLLSTELDFPKKKEIVNNFPTKKAIVNNLECRYRRSQFMSQASCSTTKFVNKQITPDETTIPFDEHESCGFFTNILKLHSAVLSERYARHKLKAPDLKDRMVGISYYNKASWNAIRSVQELSKLTMDNLAPTSDGAATLASASLPTMGAAALASTGHNILEAKINCSKARDAEKLISRLEESTLKENNELLTLLKDQAKLGLTEKKLTSNQKRRIYVARTPVGLGIFAINAAGIAAGGIAPLGTPLIVIGSGLAATYLVLEGVRFKEAYTHKQNLCHVKAVTEAYSHMNNPIQQYETFLEKLNEEFDRKYVSKSTKYKTIVTRKGKGKRKRKRKRKRKVPVFKPNKADEKEYAKFKSCYDNLIKKLKTVAPLKDIEEVKQEVEKEIKDLEHIACTFLDIKPKEIKKRELQSQLDIYKKAIDHIKFRQRTTCLSKSNPLQYFVKYSSSFHDPDHIHKARKKYEEHYEDLVKKVNNGTCEQSDIDSDVKKLSDFIKEDYLQIKNYNGEMLASPARFGEKSLAQTIVNKLIDTATTQEDRTNLVIFCSSLLTDSENELFNDFFTDLKKTEIGEVDREISVKKRHCFRSKKEEMMCSKHLVEIMTSRLQST